MAGFTNKIGIDIRSLQDPVARGVSAYGRSIIEAMIQTQGSDAFRFFTAGSSPLTLPSPLTGARGNTHLRLPSKVVNLGMRFFGSPTIDGMLGEKNIFMPNLNFWSVGSKARLTVTVHDLSFLVDPTWFTPRERLWHRLINLKGLLRRADAIITLSRHTKSELVDLLNIDEEKIHHIAPGVPMVSQSHPSSPLFQGRNQIFNPLFEKEGVGGVPFPYILFLGAIEARKNIAGALAAFELLAKEDPNIHFVLAGPRPNRRGKTSPIFANRSFASADRIHFLGQVDAEQKGALLRNAKALFLPSFYEGFGFPAIEAMSVGVPVVASSAGALSETVGNAGLLLDPMDTSGFANALHQILSDEQLRQTLIARGYERIKDFSWERCAEETLKIITNF